jgi:hypothetical protein
MRLCTLLVMAIGLGIVSQPPKKDDKLRQELLRRMQADQEARKSFLSHSAFKRMKEIDHDNTERMKEIIKQFGWPGKSLVGTDGANAAWLLVQHADHDPSFQKQCLELLQAAMKKGEATCQQLAYLTDRVLTGENKKQVYGTQFRRVDGKLLPFPIEDEANVDKRRKEVGLESLADYLKSAQEFLEKGGKK